MKKRRKLVQISILLCAAVIAGLTIWNEVRSHHSTPVVGSKAPDFSLEGTDGTIHHLADYRGKAVLLNFWGTYCPDCIQEMPDIEKQYAKWKDSGFVVLGVNIGENPITVKGYINDHQISYPIFYDPNKQVTHQYDVNQYPTSLFINAKGKIEAKFIGPMTESYLQQHIIQLIQK